MTTITFKENIKIDKTEFDTFYDFTKYIENFSIPELNFTKYVDLSIEDKKLYDSYENIDINKCSNI